MAGGQTCRTWDVVCHELSQTWRCIALDQRGHGDSEWSYEFDYSIEAHAADTAALIEALDLAPVVIVGNSLGGLNALCHALARPETVARIWACTDANHGHVSRMPTGVSGFWRVGGSLAGEPLCSL